MATDPALIGWQRLGGSPSTGKSIIQVCTSRHLYRRVGLPPEREAAGRKPRHQIRNQCSRPHTKMRNVMMNISWTYKGNTAKLTRLVKALNEHSRAWREVMNKEGDVPQAVGMLCQSDLRRRLQGERHLVKQGGSTASAHLQGGWDGMDREGIVSQRPRRERCHVYSGCDT